METIIQLFSKYKIDIIITTLLCIFAFIFFILSGQCERYNDLFTNLSAGFIGSIVTIWGIEFLRRKQFEKKTMNARNVAKQEIEQLRNMLTSYISNSFDILIDQYIKGAFSEENIVKAIKQLLEDLTKKNLLEILSQLNVSQWSHFQTNLPLIRLDLSEKIQLYHDILPEEVFGQLLIINKNFKNIYSMFGILSDLFTREEKDWPINKKGIEENRKIRLAWLNNLASNLKTYFEDVNKLSNMLERIKF